MIHISQYVIDNLTYYWCIFCGEFSHSIVCENCKAGCHIKYVPDFRSAVSMQL